MYINKFWNHIGVVITMVIEVQINAIVGVSYWTWNCKDMICGICCEAFDQACPRCRAPGDACPPAFGQCKHSFHLHCIDEWLTRSHSSNGGKQLCPLCRGEFIFMVAGVD